jgi:hypothetical protein
MELTKKYIANAKLIKFLLVVTPTGLNNNNPV